MANAPQMKKEKKPMIDGGSAFRLNKKPSSTNDFSNKVTCRLLNLLVMKSEHNDRPIQTKKRKVKPKLLIRNIPRGGAKALETL